MYKLLYKTDDAIAYYMNILSDAIKSIGEDAIHVTDFSEINPDDKVVTVLARDFVKLWRRKGIHPVVNWFQGIGPEETKLGLKQNGFSLKYALFGLLLTENERFILRKSKLNLFVSNTMKEHYEKKYGYTKDNYFVMPCFNQLLQENAFTDLKYSKPTFVYTGSLAAWQCFEPMLKLFKDIKQQIHAAEMTIYTKEHDKAKELLHKYGIEANIKYVPYEQLNNEIKDYKYGFIIREDIEVNRVATPTKMNSYLANGIIPIYTDVVGAYKENISKMRFSIPLEPVTNNGIEKLYELENVEILGNAVLNEYKGLFADYYNREKYVKLLADLLAAIK